MEHVAAMLLVLGCSDGAVDCSALQHRLPQYETAQVCEAGMVDVMRSYAGAHEMVLAQCVPVDPVHAGGWELAWSVTSEGMIISDAIPIDLPRDILVASN